MTIETAQPLGGQKLRGARPSPRHKLLAAEPLMLGAPPDRAAFIPKKLSMWGNNQYGDCVSAEEAFKCAADNPEDFIPDATVIDWARKHGFLNGADLTEVMDAMQGHGFVVGPNTYNDGPYKGVDFSNEMILQTAIAGGPVKIGIDANALPSGAGNVQGWYALGSGQQFRNEDHCVSICGYGPAEWLYEQLGVPMPSELAGKTGYLIFTWMSIGFVDHKWIMSTVGEAWARTPPTIIVGPEPQPQPPTPPTPPPPPPPPPKPAPTWWQEFVAWIESLLGIHGRDSAQFVLPWSEIIIAIQVLIKEYGPEALPIIEQFLATLPIPPWALKIINAMLQQLLGKQLALQAAPLPGK